MAWYTRFKIYYLLLIDFMDIYSVFEIDIEYISK